MQKKDNALLYLLIIIGFIVFLLKSINLNLFSMWLDEGFYYLAAREINKHGYPLYPSGHILFKGIFHSYFLSVFYLLSSGSTYVLRAVSLLLHCLLPIISFQLLKEYINKHILLIVALLYYLSIWETEFSRTLLYFSLLQFLFTISLILFFKSKFTKGRTNYAIPYILTNLTHQLGIALSFSFLSYLILKPKDFFKRKNIIITFIWGLFFGLIMFQEVLFWKVGQVYSNQESSITDIISYFFSKLTFIYFKLLYISANYGFLIFMIGSLSVIFFYFKNFSKHKTDIENQLIVYLDLTILFSLFGLGFMKTHPMPRYLYQFNFIFILLVVWFIYKFIMFINKYFKGRDKNIIIIPLVFIISYFSFKHIDLIKSANIIKRRYNSIIENNIITTSGRSFQIDHKDPGEFVRRRIKKDDIIIAMHMVFQYIYAGKVDYWLWTGGPGTWDGWEKINGEYRDVYLGVKWINNLLQLKNTIKKGLMTGKNIWIITSPSEERRDHINDEIRTFLFNNRGRIKYISKDGVSKVYLFDKSSLSKNTVEYKAEWGFYNKKNLIKSNKGNFILLSQKQEYETSRILYSYTKKIKIKTKTNARTFVRLSFIGKKEKIIKTFMIKKRETLIDFNPKEHIRHYLKLKILRGKNLYLKSFEIYYE